MNNQSSSSACGYAVSVPGAGHIRYGTPCQDASGVIFTPRSAAIVCDGRGSAPNSHFGAQGAVKAFFSQVSVLEPFIAGALDQEAPAEKWTNLCRLFYRTLLQTKLDLAAEKGGSEKDYDFTVAFAISGRVSVGVFQVGDGAIVLRQSGVCQTAFPPDKGEFANQTHFLRQGGEESGKFHARLFPADVNTGIAITSDGPEYLMFRQADMTPGPIFDKMLDDLAANDLQEQDVRDYLTRSVWSTDARGADDRSLAVLLPGQAARAACVTCEDDDTNVTAESKPVDKDEPVAEGSDGRCDVGTYRRPEVVAGGRGKLLFRFALPVIAAALIFLAGGVSMYYAMIWNVGGHVHIRGRHAIASVVSWIANDVRPTTADDIPEVLEYIDEKGTYDDKPFDDSGESAQEEDMTAEHEPALDTDTEDETINREEQMTE